MKYLYCLECKEPIGCQSTFYEAVVKGKTHKKKLKESCGKSKIDGFKEGYCRDCYIKLKKQFGKTECNHTSCIKNNNGHCDYVLRK